MLANLFYMSSLFQQPPLILFFHQFQQFNDGLESEFVVSNKRAVSLSVFVFDCNGLINPVPAKHHASFLYLLGLLSLQHTVELLCLVIISLSFPLSVCLWPSLGFLHFVHLSVFLPSPAAEKTADRSQTWRSLEQG